MVGLKYGLTIADPVAFVGFVNGELLTQFLHILFRIQQTFHCVAQSFAWMYPSADMGTKFVRYAHDIGRDIHGPALVPNIMYCLVAQDG